MRILVAEDDALYRAMFQRLLSPEYEPTFAEDGIAAWRLLQLEDAPQLVILDWLNCRGRVLGTRRSELAPVDRDVNCGQT